VTAVGGRGRLVALVLVALAVVALVVVVARALLGGDDPPANRAATLAPKDTLVWVHVSTDGDRDAVQDATKLAGRFGSYERLRDGILRRLAGTNTDVAARDLEP
jgi:hypothetical protein